MAGLKYRVKNWSKFQHYKNRNPPWIRLYVEILDDYTADGTENDFHALPDKDKLTLLLIWALASRYNGVIPSIDPAWLSVKLGIDNPSTDAIIKAGFLVPVSHASADASTDASMDASSTLAIQHDDCAPETDAETETETDAEGECREPSTQAPTEPNVAPHGQRDSDVPWDMEDPAACSWHSPPNKAMRPKPPRKPKRAADDLERLRATYAPIGVDVDRELVKCRAWCAAQGVGEPTLRRFVNWLNRADRKIVGADNASPPPAKHRGMTEVIPVRIL
jgi:hypothetical protein